jgi:hypothetical protein
MMSADKHAFRGTKGWQVDKLHMSEMQVRRAALICALLIGACAALGIIFKAYTIRAPSIEDCAATAQKAERLSCYDALAREYNSREPAKGSIAPALSR